MNYPALVFTCESGRVIFTVKEIVLETPDGSDALGIPRWKRGRVLYRPVAYAYSDQSPEEKIVVSVFEWMQKKITEEKKDEVKK